ncbi:hypothetical protein C8R45DRAFT_874403 [Mycena sanguinolenta]|nr:hypothetical protein C8R45DRAFT_874403 [Mycena sanguinolenta]
MPAEIIEIDNSEDESPTTTMKEPLSGIENTFSDFESDNDENEVEPENQKPLIAPSTDIKADFEDVLQNGFEFDGAFAFSERYGMGAPNPCLNIDGLGPIGIPLNQREANIIISACDPSGDTNASGIWEMSPEKVHFDNPCWDVWIQSTAGVAASDGLGAYGGVRPIFTFKKLVIHGPGSQLSHHKEPISEDESDTKIGDLVAILPGLFHGGQLQLSYAGQIKSLNLAHQSGISTSIVAAYSGVEHTLASVASGYRLSLLYEIVQPITHADDRPTLPEMQGATQKLRHIMLSWKQGMSESGEPPEYLACLLQHKYAKSLNFSAKSLTGADALLVSHLHPLARQLKFRLYFAHVQVEVTTSLYASEYSCRRRRDGWGTSDDECDWSDIDECDFKDDGESGEESLRIIQVVDLRGMPVDVDLELDADDLLNGSVTDGDPDESSFERDERTSATRTETYNRTVLLLWPKDSDLDLSVTVGDIYDYASNALRSSLTDVPSKRERRLVNQLLVCCQTRRKDAKLRQAVQVLRESADRWNDVEMLLRAMEACGADRNIDLIGVEGFVSIYQAFGWDALKDFYGDVMQNDESNVRRNALLARLARMAVEEDDAEVSLWCEEQTERVLESLGTADASQIPWLASVGLARGGKFLRDVIFPQLKAQKLGKPFWIAFIQRLRQCLKDVPTTSLHIVSGLISQTVSHIARNLPAFPTRVVKSTYGTERSEEHSDTILEVVKLCVETQNETLCGDIFAKMRDAVRAGSFNAPFPPWEYYSKLSTSFMQYMDSIPGLDAIFQPFFIDTVYLMIASTLKTSDGRAATPCSLTENDRATVIRVARRAGGIFVLQQSVTADMLKGRPCSTLKALAQSVKKEFPPPSRDHDMTEAYDQVISTLVQAAIRAFDTSSLVKRQATAYRYGQTTATPSQQMLAMIDFCFQVGARSHCQHLLPRFLIPPAGITAAQHASGVLAPFVPVLRDYLANKHSHLHVEPYKTFVVAVAKLFAEHVMGVKPREVVPVTQLQAIGCPGCTECRTLKAFFLGDRTTISFQANKSVRLHLEGQLAVTRAWGVSWKTNKTRATHILEIAKPATVAALGKWARDNLAGKTLLLALGDSTAQKRILGPDYALVHARISGVNEVTPLGNATRTVNVPKRTATNSLSNQPTKKARTS